MISNSTTFYNVLPYLSFHSFENWCLFGRCQSS